MSYEDEDIDLRNSMREYLHYDLNHKLVAIPESALAEWTARIEALLAKHCKPQIDIWQGVV